MDMKQLFIAVEHQLQELITAINPGEFPKLVPEWFAIGGAQPIETTTLRDIVNYMAYDDAWVPETLAGKTIAEVGVDTYKGDLLVNDIPDNFKKYNDAAIAATEAINDLQAVTHLSYGDYPIEEYLQHITMYRGSRIFDIAKASNTEFHLPDEIVQAIYNYLQPQAEAWRAMGVFGPEVSVPSDASISQRFLGLIGRQPN